jgi:hypothetical protein
LGYVGLGYCILNCWRHCLTSLASAFVHCRSPLFSKVTTYNKIRISILTTNRANHRRCAIKSASQFPVNLIIPVTTTEEEQIVEKILSDALPNYDFLSKIYYENPDETQRARLLINGEEVKRGTVEQMKEAFTLQSSINSKANIIVQEWQKQPLSNKSAGFVTVQSRIVKVYFTN